ncbi:MULTISPECIES: glycosyltransferase [unclassified Salipiger]|uniref:CgeB family protein n=1 Tax=unclassified Salipiger TaxID=2640570 RepID=UPI0013B68EA9|nr:MULTISPECIES: glycosyltransferase [unclassified Salipiger]NDV49286.1 glycosyltransferase [Salipiger sp. PrR003]NDW32759.1 glycosyltransferase [Salipiger sp. PrR007]
MRFTFFTQSLVSDWNHGNAHFLRGIMRALQQRGHDCRAMEPADGWSRRNLIEDCGPAAVEAFHATFPDLRSETYHGIDDLDRAVDGSDVVIVHEWTEPAIVSALGRKRAAGGTFRLLFHDTHHRAASADAEIRGLDLSAYDGVLAFGESLREVYLGAGWARQVFTWHEAADDTLFRPQSRQETRGELVWVGNWGDGERTAELAEFLLGPVADLGLTATAYGVRYPPEALEVLNAAGLRYAGPIANASVPRVFGEHQVTVHIPRRPYVRHLPGIPTIRVFEALACGIPLVCAPWSDSEGLFRAGHDYLQVGNGEEMNGALRDVLHDPALAAELSRNGLATIAARHTCRHRARELLKIVNGLALPQKEVVS